VLSIALQLQQYTIVRVTIQAVNFIRLVVILPAQRYASAGTSYGPVSVCLSVSLSQVGVLSKGMNGLIWFWHGGFFRPVLHCVLRKFRYLQYRSKGTSLWNFVLNSGLRKVRHGMSIVKRAINLTRERWTLRA